MFECDIFGEIGLEKYKASFERASEDMIELYASRTDEDVDAIIKRVEQANDFEFPNKDRCLIWKSLRYLWFTSPGASKNYIDPAEVPRLVLPKHDFRARDQGIELASLEPDRQKMILRKSVYDEMKGAITVQEEVYKRESHLSYILKGLERTIEYWMSQDPRKMAREDPREESLINQIKLLELDISGEIDKMRLRLKATKIVNRFFMIVKVLFLAASFLYLIVAIIDSPSTNVPSMTRFLSSSHLRLSVVLFATFSVITETTRGKPVPSRFHRAKGIHAKCRMLHSEMISFRLKTHYVRQNILLRYLDDSHVAMPGDNVASSNTEKTTAAGVYDNYIGSLLRMSPTEISNLSFLPSNRKKSLISRFSVNHTTTLNLERKVLPLDETPGGGDPSVSEKSLEPEVQWRDEKSQSNHSGESEDAASRLSHIMSVVEGGLINAGRRRDQQTVDQSIKNENQDQDSYIQDSDDDEDDSGDAKNLILNSQGKYRNN